MDSYMDSIFRARADYLLSKSLSDSLVEFYYKLKYHKNHVILEPKVWVSDTKLTIKGASLSLLSSKTLIEVLKESLSVDIKKCIVDLTPNQSGSKSEFKLVTDILADNGLVAYIEYVHIVDCTYFSIELR